MIGGLAFVTAVSMLLSVRGLKASVVVFWMLYAIVAGVFSFYVG